MKTIVIDNVEYTIRDMLKSEYDKWEGTYGYDRICGQLYGLANMLVELEKRFERGEIKQEVYKRLVDFRTESIEKIREKFCTPRQEKPSLFAEAEASKLSICVENPKLTVDEWLKKPKHVFDTLFNAVEEYQLRFLKTTEEAKLDKILELLNEFEEDMIKLSDVITLIENIRKGIDIKKK